MASPLKCQHQQIDFPMPYMNEAPSCADCGKKLADINKEKAANENHDTKQA